MDRRRVSAPTILVVTADPELLDHVLSITAAVGVDPLVIGEPAAVRASWSSAAMVLVGQDEAASVVAHGLPRRAEVYVIGDDDAPSAAYRWSAGLGAAVLTLPSAAGWLSAAVADHAGEPGGSGRVVAVLGGSGGVGTSTLAAAVAYVGARQGCRVVLVDADPRGGGADLLLGAERVDGWRWGRLATARGHLGDLTGLLPSADGVDLLAMPRGESPAGWAPDAEQLEAVLRSTRRSHDLTVVDLSRDVGVTGRAVLTHADLSVLLVRGDIRGVAAARELVRCLDPGQPLPGLVVRHARSRVLTAETVAAGLGLTLLGRMPDDPGLALGAERGDPPGRSARSPLARLGEELLDRLSRAEPAAVPAGRG